MPGWAVGRLTNLVIRPSWQSELHARLREQGGILVRLWDRVYRLSAIPFSNSGTGSHLRDIPTMVAMVVEVTKKKGALPDYGGI